MLHQITTIVAKYLRMNLRNAGMLMMNIMIGSLKSLERRSQKVIIVTTWMAKNLQFWNKWKSNKNKKQKFFQDRVLVEIIVFLTLKILTILSKRRLKNDLTTVYLI